MSLLEDGHGDIRQPTVAGEDDALASSTYGKEADYDLELEPAGDEPKFSSN